MKNKNINSSNQNILDCPEDFSNETPKSEDDIASEQATAMLDLIENLDSDANTETQPSKSIASKPAKKKSNKKQTIKDTPEPDKPKHKAGCLGCLGYLVVFVLICSIITHFIGGSSSSTSNFSASSSSKISASSNQPELKPSSSSSQSQASEVEVRSNNTVDPKLKRFLDEYEAFFDEYIDFMEKLDSADASDMTWLNEYAEYMDKYSDYMSALEAYDTETMSDADAAYYFEVTTRVSTKLLNIAN